MAVMWIRVSNLMKVISQTPRAGLEAELDQSVVSPWHCRILRKISPWSHPLILRWLQPSSRGFP